MTDSQESRMSELTHTHERTDVAVDETDTAGLAPQEPTEIRALPRTKERPGLLPRLRSGRATFRLWRLRRPFWGAILMLLASLLMLAGPVALLRSAFLPGSAVPLALLVGGLMLVMALAQLFVPAYALITGLIGIVLSIVSLITGSFGGFGIGMILGILGSAQGVAWKANARALPTRGKTPGRKRKAAKRKP